MMLIWQVQKRRNYSKDLLQQKLFNIKDYQKSNHSNSYPTLALIKERSLNQSNITLEQKSIAFKKKNVHSSTKLNLHFNIIDQKFASLSSKIRDLLKNDEQEQKENQNQKSQFFTTNYFQKNKSQIFRRSELQRNEQPEKILTSLPYFIENLKRKNIISTETCMHIHNTISTFKQFTKSIQSVRPRLPDSKIPPQIQNRKTIVFDMDETLIHTSDIMVKGYEIKVPFKSFQGKTISGYVSVRPYAKQIIKNLSKFADIIVFTAGNQCYADPILDYLDPDGCLKYRLYRQSCTFVMGQIFVKDLRVIGRKLQNVVLVDNAPHSYMMQMANGIPILNYIKGKDDDQLVKLEPYLMSLLNVDDVRESNSQIFRMHEYIRYESYERLVSELYGKWF